MDCTLGCKTSFKSTNGPRQLPECRRLTIRSHTGRMPSFQFRLFPGWRELPHCSAVANGKIHDRPYQVDQYRTTLSVKSVVEGAAFYRTRQGHYRIEEGSFLILNEGQEYALDISPGSKTETL